MARMANAHHEGGGNRRVCRPIFKDHEALARFAHQAALEFALRPISPITAR
jgi:hypothetical protein